MKQLGSQQFPETFEIVRCFFVRTRQCAHVRVRRMANGWTTENAKSSVASGATLVKVKRENDGQRLILRATRSRSAT